MSSIACGWLRIREIVVALLMAGAADELVTTEVIFVERQALDLRPHRAIEDQDPLACSLFQGLRKRRRGAANRSSSQTGCRPKASQERFRRCSVSCAG